MTEFEEGFSHGFKAGVAELRSRMFNALATIHTDDTAFKAMVYALLLQGVYENDGKGKTN